MDETTRFLFFVNYLFICQKPNVFQEGQFFKKVTQNNEFSFAGVYLLSWKYHIYSLH